MSSAHGVAGARTARGSHVGHPMASSSRRALLGAMAANIGIAATKFIVGAFTASTVMITEAIHSLVDTGNAALMLLGRRRSKRAADAAHPFGYGLELYFWSFVVAMVVFGGGGGVSIYKGIRAFSEPHATGALWLNYTVLAVAALFEGASLVVGIREFDAYRRELDFKGSRLALIRASKNPAIFMTVLEDTAALVGLAIAAIGLTLERLTGNLVWDGVASILIGLVLVAEAALLAIECRELIIGEAARTPVIARVKKAIARHAGTLAVGEARTLQLGPDAILVVVDLDLSPAQSVELHQHEIDALVTELRKEVPAIRDVVFDVAG